MGRLYNKEAVIEALLDRSNLPETAQHIKNLKVKKVVNVNRWSGKRKFNCRGNIK
jgi:hypothetical protein